MKFVVNQSYQKLKTSLSAIIFIVAFFTIVIFMVHVVNQKMDSVVSVNEKNYLQVITKLDEIGNKENRFTFYDGVALDKLRNDENFTIHSFYEDRHTMFREYLEENYPDLK